MSSMELMCLPITPNHIRLIIACYPPAPLAAGPDYRPNSQELSRLTYYASNRPGKLHKLSNELEKRAKNQARKAQNGNAKARALLLVTLDILKSLTAECRRDLSLFSDAVLASVEAAMACSPADLELIARAASLFTAWTTYTDGTLLCVANSLSRSYVSILTKFAKMSTFEDVYGDEDFRNRTRLVGLAVLSSSIQSDVLSNSATIYPQQVNIIIPALLGNISHAELSLLSAEATAVETYSNQMSPSPFMSEFQPQKPIAERRARSIHLHIDGEKGPSYSDVLNASLRAFKALLSFSNALQIPQVLEAAFQAFDALETKGGWNDRDLCCWLSSRAAVWTQYQYRYAIPSRLLQLLVDNRDAPTPTPLHFAVISMISTIFTSSTPLINLSTSDILTNLVNVIISRLVIDPSDPLLPALVDCTSSLGTHIYYTDQIQDLAEELITRLVNVQITGLLGRGRSGDEKGREEGLQCLLACLDGLFRTAAKYHPDPETSATPISTSLAEKLHLNTSLADGGGDLAMNGTRRKQHGRRSKVAPEVWHDTVALLCEAEYAVRNDYATALVHFISNEVHKEPFALNSQANSDANVYGPNLDPAKRFQTAQAERLMISDPTIRFLHALHAAAFTLAVSPSLGLNTTSPPTSSHSSSAVGLVPPATINVIAPTPDLTPRKEIIPMVTAEPPSTTTDSTTNTSPSSPGEHVLTPTNQSSINLHRRPTLTPTRSRSVSVGLKFVDTPPSTISGTAPAPATPSDYSHLLKILTSIHENLPARSLFAGVPMLVALANAAKLTGESSDKDFVTLQRKLAINELVCKTWLVIAKVWDCNELEDLAESALSKLSSTSSLPPVQTGLEKPFPHRAEPSLFLKTPEGFVMPYLLPTDSVDSTQAIELLSQSANVQKALGLGADVVLQRLSAPWSTEIAIEESVEKVGLPEHYRESTSHFLRLSPGLMHADNKSLHSIARTVRGVGVGDLREALEGRGSMSNPALASAAQSMNTTVEHHRGALNSLQPLSLSRSRTQDANTQARKVSKNNPDEVRNVLNKLGVGKQTGSALLHAPFPSGIQHKTDENSPSIFVPPYK